MSSAWIFFNRMLPRCTLWRKAKALLTLANINMGKDSDLGAVETALKNATEAHLGRHGAFQATVACGLDSRGGTYVKNLTTSAWR